MGAEGANDQLSVVHLVAEYWPFARSGGLAEAVRGIATYQASSGVPTLVLMPLYKRVRENTEGLVQIGEPIEVPIGSVREPVRLWEIENAAPGPRVVFVDHPGRPRASTRAARWERTASTTRSAARSTSSGVVKRPSPKRIEPAMRSGARLP